MSNCRVVYNDIPFFLVKDEQAQVELLCQHIAKRECDQVLVSGASGQRIHMVGSKEIESQLGKDWNIDVIVDRSENGLTSFLMKFAQEIRTDRTRKRIRFAPAAPRQLKQFLSAINTPCCLGYYEIGFDMINQEKFTMECDALLKAWRKRVTGSVYHFEGIVDSEDNHFNVQSQMDLRRVLWDALEKRDG